MYTRPGPRSQNITPTLEHSLSSYAYYYQATFNLVQVLMGKFVPFPERNSAVVQVRMSCSDRAPNINTMAKNISHLFVDDGVVIMGDEEAARSSLERTVCWRGRLVDQKGAEHDKSLVDEETLPASRGSVYLFGDYFNTKDSIFCALKYNKFVT